MSLNERAQQALNEMYDIVDSVDIENIKTKGITIRSGKKLVKLEVISEEDISIEDEIRYELAQQISDKMEEIKKRLNQRLKDEIDITKQVRREFERKERELRRQLASSQLMPNVTKADAKKGISVVKGISADSYYWLVRGIYWPKYYITNKEDEAGNFITKPLKEAISKRMISEVIFLIETSGNRILNVTTRKPITLELFDHYHQWPGDDKDCWGDWKWPETWSTPDDLLKIGKAAQSVLETINSNSMAKDNPKGLPRKTTIENRGLDEENVIRKHARLDQEHIRIGINEEINAVNDDVWTT